MNPEIQIRSGRYTQRRGTLIIPAALLMIVVVAFLALAIDSGFMSTVRSELQRSADSAALAGASVLISEPRSVDSISRHYAQVDVCGGRKLEGTEVTVQVGHWDDLTRLFVAGATPTDAVRVTTYRSDVPTLFASGLGRTPIRIESNATATFEPRDIMMVLDISGSMNQANKIASLKQAVRAFLKVVEDVASFDRVGFATYSSSARLDQSLTTNYTNVNKLVQALVADGWTNIGDGMAIGRQELINNGRPNVQKLMILMTDGIANRPTNRNPLQYVRDEADAAAAARISVFAISFGSDADKVLMADVAARTGSTYIHVNEWASRSEDDLSDVFRKIAADRPLKLVD